jgi:hypothetical protein
MVEDENVPRGRATSRVTEPSIALGALAAAALFLRWRVVPL